MADKAGQGRLLLQWISLTFGSIQYHFYFGASAALDASAISNSNILIFRTGLRYSGSNADRHIVSIPCFLKQVSNVSVSCCSCCSQTCQVRLSRASLSPERYHSCNPCHPAVSLLRFIPGRKNGEAYLLIYYITHRDLI